VARHAVDGRQPSDRDDGDDRRRVANLLVDEGARVCMDRQQIIALVLVGLMVFSSLAYAVSLF